MNKPKQEGLGTDGTSVSEDVEVVYDPTEYPVERDDGSGKWDAGDNGGYGHVLGYSSRELVEVWLEGYGWGEAENR